MGIKDLLKIAKKQLNITSKGKKDNLKTAVLGSRRLGVDISVFMHILITRKHCAMAFHQQPGVCFQDFVNMYFNPILKSANEMNITLEFVFDGHSHPHKETTNAERSEKRIENMAKINALYEGKDESKLDEISGLMQKSTSFRIDFIACVVAWATNNGVVCIGVPFEADWQLRQLEMDGIIDGIITVDSDLLALSCELIVYDLQFTKDGECNLLARQNILDALELADEDF